MSETTEKQTAHLEDWYYSQGRLGYALPDRVGKESFLLSGIVSGHPRLEDGKMVYTSRVLSREGCAVETRNTNYTLGEISAGYLDFVNSNGFSFDPKTCEFKKIV